MQEQNDYQQLLETDNDTKGAGETHIIYSCGQTYTVIGRQTEHVSRQLG